jgi:hypothetical protein
MSKGYYTAVDIESGIVNIEFVLTVERLAGEGLVQFNEIVVCDIRSRSVHQIVHGRWL